MLKDIAKVTFDQLDEFGIPYDEIHFGKPHADVYIDGKSVNPTTEFAKTLPVKEKTAKKAPRPRVFITRNSAFFTQFRLRRGWGASLREDNSGVLDLSLFSPPF